MAPSKVPDHRKLLKGVKKTSKAKFQREKREAIVAGLDGAYYQKGGSTIAANRQNAEDVQVNEGHECKKLDEEGLFVSAKGDEEKANADDTGPKRPAKKRKLSEEIAPTIIAQNTSDFDCVGEDEADLGYLFFPQNELPVPTTEAKVEDQSTTSFAVEGAAATLPLSATLDDIVQRPEAVAKEVGNASHDATPQAQGDQKRLTGPFDVEESHEDGLDDDDAGAEGKLDLIKQETPMHRTPNTHKHNAEVGASAVHTRARRDKLTYLFLYEEDNHGDID